MRCILFDMGNVLVRYSADRRYGQLGEVTGLGRAAAERLLVEDDWHARYESGEMTTAAFAARMIEAAKTPCTTEDVVRAFTDVFSEMVGMPALLQALKKDGLRLVVVSNTNENDFASVGRLYPAVLAPFDAFVLSHEVKAFKPAPAFYVHALKAAQAAPTECVFVDDLPQNVAGARAAGMHGVVFTTPEACRAELAKLLRRDLGTSAR